MNWDPVEFAMIQSVRIFVPLLINTLVLCPAICRNHELLVSAAADGTAQITQANGTVTKIPKEPDQAGISEAQTAPHDRAVGWLVEYKVEGISDTVPGTLIVWRLGKPIRRFPTDQSFYIWRFYAEGRQVAYHTGPLHGESKSHCELHDIESGRTVAVWEGNLESGDNRPAWTKTLNH
jgi:hypothetical protein